MRTREQQTPGRIGSAGRRHVVAAVCAAVALAISSPAHATVVAGRPVTEPATTQAPATPAGFRLTTLVFRVTGCNGCWIDVERQVNPDSTTLPHDPQTWQGPRVRIVKGKATTRVPTIWTPGLSFGLTAPWEVDRGAAPLIVTRYAHRNVGQSVSPSFAAKSHSATACWAGSGSTSIVLHVVVTRFRAKNWHTGKLGWASRPYFSPTLRTVGRLWSAPQGTIEVQDYFPC
jgi:methionine-rich copper-binding protein CopC